VSALPLIALNKVSKRYRNAQLVLRDITLEVDSGDLVVICGHSGAGKSTLLKLMCAIERPSEGNVVVAGQNTRALSRSSAAILRRKFGIVFQDRKLLFDRTVFANVMLPLEICGFERREAARRVRAALDKVGLLSKEKAMPLTLSGGEQQRLCIARAIVHRPMALIVDEPTAHLDELRAGEIVDMLRAFHQLGAAVVLSTHDAALAARLRGRAVVLEAGALAAHAQPPAIA